MIGLPVRFLPMKFSFKFVWPTLLAFGAGMGGAYFWAHTAPAALKETAEDANATGLKPHSGGLIGSSAPNA